MAPADSRPARLTFAEAVAQLDARVQRRRLAAYLTLSAWTTDGPPSRELPRFDEVMVALRMPKSTFHESFGRAARPELAQALGAGERDGVDRLVIETKDFTIRPWLRGWDEQVRLTALASPVAAEALVRTVTAWAINHRHLAAMNDLELAPVVRRACLRLVAPDTADELVATVVTAVAAVVDDPGATPLVGLNAVRSRLRALTFEDGELQRRSLELAAAVGRFMLLVDGQHGEVDSQLIRMMRLALDELADQEGAATS